MNKRIISIIIIVFLLQLFGCNNGTDFLNNEEKSLESNQNEKLIIYDNQHFLGEIYHFGNIIQIDNGIVYSKWCKSNELATVMEYYRYNYNDKKSIFLGEINGWSLQTQETTFVNNHVYFFVSTGDITSYDNRELKLMDINIEKDIMSEVFSEKGGFPYCTLEKRNDKVVMVKVNKNGSSIEEYNPQTSQIRRLKSFDYDDAKNVGEAIRSLSVDEENNTISLLILKNVVATSPTLSIKTYDYDFKLLKSSDISFIFSDNNEVIQGVTSFECNDRYFYYENFSITRYLGLFKNNSIEPMNVFNETFEISRETVKDNFKIFYEFGDNSKSIYLFDTNECRISKSTLKTKDERYYIINMSKNRDKLSILLGYKDPDGGDKLNTLLYNTNLSDLDFKLIEAKT